MDGAGRRDAARRRIAGLDTEVRGAIEAQGTPVVVLLHGYASCGDDLAPLFDAFVGPSPGVRFLFPDGPLAVAPEVGRQARPAHAWWPIDTVARDASIARGHERDLSRTLPLGLAEAREIIHRLLDEIETTLAPSRLVIGGFSQGAILACDLSLRSTRKLDGLVLLSGARIAMDEWRPLYVGRRGLPVFQSHGRDDAHLAFSVAERLHRELEEAGLDATWIPFDGGHETPLVVLRALRKFVRQFA